MIWVYLAIAVAAAFGAAILRAKATLMHKRCMNQVLAETDPDRRRYMGQMGLISEAGAWTCLAACAGFLVAFFVALF